ncbi:MAG: DNA polymerase III subunit alpha, partial [Bacteroidales bacterium]|nr:DNA polymerase III subunit alpha [Bacteroidales bacterium]
DMLEKIWADWEKFASYAFNKSHATCYAWVSYQTGWLKAHYPAEFQAANLTKNLSNMDEIKKIMDDCKKNGIKVLNPDINESDARFTVNKQGEIRFGLGGIKGFGDNIVRAILADREENGLFADIYDFVERMSGTVNRKAFESLLHAGAFDSFGICRKQFMLPSKSGDTFLDTLIRYGELYRKDSMDSSISLFGEVEELKPERPEIPPMVGEENILDRLQQEKELVGMYLSSHPLEQYRFEIDNFTSCQVSELDNLVSECEMKKEKRKVSIAGFITKTDNLVNRNGRPWSKTVIEDFGGSYEIALFGKDHENFMSYMTLHNAIFIEGEIDEKYYLKPEERAQGKTSPYAFKIKKIMLLGNVTDTYIKGFAINVTTPMLTPEFREKLVRIIKRNKGNVPLSMFLYDPEKKWNIEFLSRKFRVGVTAEFIEELERLRIRYTVLKK